MCAGINTIYDVPSHHWPLFYISLDIFFRAVLYWVLVGSTISKHYTLRIISMELSQRISRVIGQLKGIQKMVEEKRDCGDVLQQVSAVKKAIDALSKEIVVSNICEFLPHKDVEKVSRMIERAINL